MTRENPYRTPGQERHCQPAARLKTRWLWGGIPVCTLVLGLYFGLFELLDQLGLFQSDNLPASGTDIATSIVRGLLGGMFWGVMTGLFSLPALLVVNRRNSLHGPSAFLIVLGAGQLLGSLLLLIQPPRPRDQYLVWTFCIGCAMMAAAAALYIVILQSRNAEYQAVTDGPGSPEKALNQ